MSMPWLGSKKGEISYFGGSFFQFIGRMDWHLTAIYGSLHPGSVCDWAQARKCWAFWNQRTVSITGAYSNKIGDIWICTVVFVFVLPSGQSLKASRSELYLGTLPFLSSLFARETRTIWIKRVAFALVYRSDGQRSSFTPWLHGEAPDPDGES